MASSLALRDVTSRHDVILICARDSTDVATFNGGDDSRLSYFSFSPNL